MTPEIEPEDEPKPRRLLRRSRGATSSETVDDGPDAASDASGVDPQAGEEQAPGAEVEDEAVAEVEPTAGDVEAEEAAADVMLEGDDEAEGEPEAEDEDEEEEAGEPSEAERKRRGLRRRRKGSEPAPVEPPSRPAPARRRSRRDPNAPIPVVRAQAKYVRSSARKARLVCDHIRGKSVEEARAILALTPRAIARDWSKLLESAVANAEHNHELVGEDLYVKAVHADEGPTIKRFRPRAMGRATRIRKRTSHLTILLTPKE
jgi:ribosomal protein L22